MAGNEDSWLRQLLIGLAAIAGAAVLIGLVISLIALGAAHVTGISSTGGGASQRPSLELPPLTKVTRSATPVGPTPSPSASPKASGSSTPSPQAGKKHHRRQHAWAISLQASPSSVGAMQRITISGVYHREGATLQVQQERGGHWTDFPVTCTVQGGVFQTYLLSGQQGRNHFRVVDKQTHRTSNVVSVTVH